MWKLLQRLIGLVDSPWQGHVSDTGWANLPYTQNENSTENITMRKDTQMVCGTLQAPSSAQNLSTALAQLDETTMLVAKTAMAKLFTKGHFDICIVRDVMEITSLGRQSHPNFKLLHALHCVSYNEMPPELRNKIPQMVNELLVGDFRNEAVEAALNGIGVG